VYTLALYRNKSHLVLLLLGFSSGLPFLLILSTLSMWLSEANVSKSLIGLFMFVSLPYSIKFLWSGTLDRKKIPWLSDRIGQRRSWALLAQAGVLLSLIGLSCCDPARSLGQLACWATLVALCSATLDSVIDAYRIELLASQYLGTGAAIEAVGFRLGMLASGAGTLYLANAWGWPAAYLSMALCCLIGLAAILVSDEPMPARETQYRAIRGRSAPFIPISSLYTLLGFIFFFKLIDIVLNSMMAPFLHDLGFNKVDFAHFSKLYGTLLTIVGGLLAGNAIHRFGIAFIVKCAIALQILSALIFITQAQLGHHFPCLIISLGIESFTAGLSATAFIAFLSHFCRHGNSAQDFTLLYSFGSLSRVLVSSAAGLAADQISWEALFLLSGLLGALTFWFLPLD
jgi:MFS transporter, PAT family, beta-lactamase induction signal transducer AmpG